MRDRLRDILQLMARFPFSEWQAEMLRLTVFPSPGATVPSPEWWEAMVGAPPDENTSNPKRGAATVSGALGPGKLTLKLEPDRIDWLFLPPDPVPDPQVLEPDLPSVGAVTQAVESFSSIIERWLGRDDVPDSARVAFGAVLNHPEIDHRAGYARLPDYVPVRVEPDYSDFLYQINMPVDSRTGIQGLRINRLSKWSVAAYTLFSLRFGATAVATETRPKFSYAVRLELDINTSPLFQGAVSRNRLMEVYRELAVLGQGIATEGLLQP